MPGRPTSNPREESNAGYVEPAARPTSKFVPSGVNPRDARYGNDTELLVCAHVVSSLGSNATYVEPSARPVTRFTPSGNNPRDESNATYVEPAAKPATRFKPTSNARAESNATTDTKPCPFCGARNSVTSKSKFCGCVVVVVLVWCVSLAELAVAANADRARSRHDTRMKPVYFLPKACVRELWCQKVTQ